MLTARRIEVSVFIFFLALFELSACALGTVSEVVSTYSLERHDSMEFDFVRNREIMHESLNPLLELPGGLMIEFNPANQMNRDGLWNEIAFYMLATVISTEKAAVLEPGAFSIIDEESKKGYAASVIVHDYAESTRHWGYDEDGNIEYYSGNRMAVGKSCDPFSGSTVKDGIHVPKFAKESIKPWPPQFHDESLVCLSITYPDWVKFVSPESRWSMKIDYVIDGLEYSERVHFFPARYKYFHR